MDATVVEVRVHPGQQVTAGEVLLVLEAMKMEMPIRAELSATVAEILVAPGASVATGTPLLILDQEPSGRRPEANGR
jgi:biotin carboxyl carrier protein